MFCDLQKKWQVATIFLFESAVLLNAVAGLQMDLKNGKGVLNMCKA